MKLQNYSMSVKRRKKTKLYISVPCEILSTYYNKHKIFNKDIEEHVMNISEIYFLPDDKLKTHDKIIKKYISYSQIRVIFQKLSFFNI